MLKREHDILAASVTRRTLKIVQVTKTQTHLEIRSRKTHGWARKTKSIQKESCGS